MKKLLSLIAFSWLALTATAQQQEQCATMSVLKRQMENPVLAERYRASQQAATDWRAQHPQAKTSGAPILTIPVVVHVLYKNATQNISDAQIYSQIAILNADYRRLNADTVNTPLAFDSIAADIEVEFCLASLDPSGSPTNGITRTSTSGGQFFGFFSPIFEDAKYDSLGGHNAWPADRYLNIWVCETFPGLLGYAQFPGGLLATDGVVISHEAFGDMGTVTAPSTLGRTTIHEVGHWMGLYHIWGDDQDCVAGSDSIYDTPNAEGASSSDCQVTRNSCSNEDPYWGATDPNDMVQNYMDYSHDSCMNMFTNGQKARMHSFLNSDPVRMALFNSNAGCSVATQAAPATDQYFSIYPNPSQGRVDVDYRGPWSPSLAVEVMDLSGNLVHAHRAESSSFSLDLSALAAGVYTVRISCEGGVVVKKLLLQ
ncbi:MAG TPA: M43 family zinc metalloprotease [Bacteroidia bacterium]|nr:M43 family zinc metalloprotease [Bacteroidia bacterium]